eukprot:scaffold38025_cov25-Tisochrysis_lutea.AAC.8
MLVHRRQVHAVRLPALVTSDLQPRSVVLLPPLLSGLSRPRSVALLPPLLSELSRPRSVALLPPLLSGVSRCQSLAGAHLQESRHYSPWSQWLSPTPHRSQHLGSHLEPRWRVTPRPVQI